MARLHYNGVSGTLGASLTNSATSVTLAAALTHSGGTNVPTIASPDFLPLSILDTSNKLSEVVYVTAYTAGATTATISRGKEGTSGVVHASGDPYTHALLALDLGGVLTKTTTYGMTVDDTTIIANGSSITITLPSAVTAGATGKAYTVKNINATTATLASAAGTIDGVSTKSLVQYASISVVSDGTNWMVV
jgi:hypothetical protein